jgi:acyl-CoA reductase-like NAD-dependent aldehyde dehydrogenase
VLCSCNRGLLCLTCALVVVVVSLSLSLSLSLQLPWLGVKIAAKRNVAVPFETDPIVGSDRPVVATDPATGEVLNTETGFSADDVKEAIRRGRIAQSYWAQVSFDERRAVLRDLMTYVVEHQNEICLQSVRDTGKTPLEATYGEILTTCEKLRWIINEGEHALAPEYRTPPAMLFLKKARVEYHPIGVIGVIIPWNYPFHNVASAVASAIFAGNAAVVKVSEYANGSRAYFEEIFQNVLRKRGHSPHLVQLIPGFGLPTGQTLVEECDKLLFIGSPITGRHIVTASCKNLTPITLELGGKDPFIVFADAEFDHAVDVALRGVFTNNGQNCIAAERIYVQDSIYERFSEAVASKARNLRQCTLQSGRTGDCGALTMDGQVCMRCVNVCVSH